MKTRLPLNVIAPIADPPEMYECVIIISPGKEDGEWKAQDEAFTLEIVKNNAQKKQMAIVCDGLSQSPCSAEAAYYVSRKLYRLYEEDGIGEIVGELFEKRAAFINMPIRLDHRDSAVLNGMFEEIVKEKRSRSHQTTFIAACLEMNHDSAPAQAKVQILGCGDSGAFIFTAGGKLLYNNLGLQDEFAPLAHASAITEALPDSYDEGASHILAHSQVYDEGVRILLCSDGLYDAFATFAELFSWMSENETMLRQASEDVMSELHSRLSDKKGDDDISFVWLFPLDVPAFIPELEPVEAVVSPAVAAIQPTSNLSVKTTFWQRFKGRLS